ncbi:MAG: hypothetical protein E7559_07375 [Ruminococcaceae bacterium]|nr:hypothetical protein [Oscillospiraceae bacterium]
MKKRFTKIAALLMILCLLLALCGCGKDNSQQAGFQQNGGQGGTQSAPVSEPLGNGFTYNHAAEAGFGMGADTLADIESRFGAPAESTTDEYSSLKLITATYDWGVFEFESDGTTEPVLTYAEITDSAAAPCGLAFGTQIADCAERVYTGSGSLVGGETQQVLLYGQVGAVPSGFYSYLTAEYTSTSTDDTYSLEYFADAYESGRIVDYTLYFNGEGQLIRYCLRYGE